MRYLTTCLLFSAILLSFQLIDTQAAAQASPLDQEPAPSAASAPVSVPAPDLVRLTNGGMVRGTISELMPGEHVVIVTVTGETKRLPASEFTYAGPAVSDPAGGSAGSGGHAPSAPSAPLVAQPSSVPLTDSDSSIRPLVTVRAKTARIRFLGPMVGGQRQEGLTLYLRTGSATSGNHTASAFTRICAAPCEAELAEGSYTVGIGQKDGPAIAVREPVKIVDGKALVGIYKSRTAPRVLLLLAGLAMMGGGLAITLNGDESSSSIVAGGVLLAGGVIPMLAAMLLPDRTELRTAKTE